MFEHTSPIRRKSVRKHSMRETQLWERGVTRSPFTLCFSSGTNDEAHRTTDIVVEGCR